MSLICSTWKPVLKYFGVPHSDDTKTSQYGWYQKSYPNFAVLPLVQVSVVNKQIHSTHEYLNFKSNS